MGVSSFPVPEARSTRDRCLALCAVLGAALFTFAPAVTYGFVYDDHWTVEGNRALALPLRTFLRAVLSGDGVRLHVPDATRPAMGLSLWVDRRLFGVDPAGYHLHSLLSYALACEVALLALFALSRRRSVAVIGAVIFAVMPLHAEVVSAVNYREDLIAGTAVFGAIAYLFWPRSRPPFLDHAVLVAALLMHGLAGKESAIVVVPLSLAFLVSSPKMRPRFRSHRAALFACLVAASLWGTFRFWLAVRGADDVPLTLAHRGVGERILRTASYLDRATLAGLFPVRTSPDYAPESLPSPLALLPALALVGLTIALHRSRRSRPLALGLTLLLVGPLPTSPLVSPINDYADRYVFVSSLGGALVWGTVLEALARRVAGRAKLLALVLLLPLVFESREAMSAFRTDLALWRRATEREPESARAFAGLARELRLSGDLDGADRAADHAVLLDPGFLRARVVRIYNLLVRGDVEGARAEIAVVEARGGAHQFGMARARRCAALPPPEASRCASSDPATGGQ